MRRRRRKSEMGIDFEELAASIESMREIFRAMVAGLVADGFTEEQARALVVEITTRKADDDDE
jgi:uncharacterized membrane protein YebE (DUF533 family)